MRNISANAILNLKEVPVTLHVHGSIMTYRDDDKIVIKKASSPGINSSILLLDLTIVSGKRPMKGTPKHFVYETHDKKAKTYNQVIIRYSHEASLTVNVAVVG